MIYLTDTTKTVDDAMQHFFKYSETQFLADFRANVSNFEFYNLNLNNKDTGAIGGIDADNGSEKNPENVIEMINTRPIDDPLESFKEKWVQDPNGVV